MLGKELLLVGGLFLAAADVSRAQAVPPDTASHAPSKREGSWSAATSTGLTFLGTWTAILDSTGTVTGTWTLVDARGNARADGAWSAAKSPQGWTGAWRSVMSGRPGEYSGTWTAAVEGKPDAPLADLFEKAMQAVMSGTWRVGGLSGGWSIRTFK